MDINYLAFLRCLVALGIYKAFGNANLRKYRPYYSCGMSPYSAVIQLFDDEYDGGVLPDTVLDAMENKFYGTEPVTSYSSQLKLF